MSRKVIEVTLTYADYALVEEDQDPGDVARAVARDIARDQYPDVDWIEVTKCPKGSEKQLLYSIKGGDFEFDSVLPTPSPSQGGGET